MHPGLSDERWRALSIHEQLGNIGTEVARAARAMAQANDERLSFALDRALELFDFTLGDDRWRGPRRREIARAREVVCDFLVGGNEYGSTAASLDSYFLPYAVAARTTGSRPPVRSAAGASRPRRT
jgi:hypothetical protein